MAYSRHGEAAAVAVELGAFEKQTLEYCRCLCVAHELRVLPREEAFVGTRPDEPFAGFAVEVEVPEVEDARGEDRICSAVGTLRRLSQFLCGDVSRRT